MARLTLKGCVHPELRMWGNLDDPGDLTVTCLYCYERLIGPVSLRGRWRHADNSGLPKAPPAPFCVHQNKEIVPSIGAHQDAMCTDCGVIVRHPDGPGEWVEVIFNGYKITEEP